MVISDNDSDRYKRSRTYRNAATTLPCCSDEWISRVSRVLLMTDTTREALQLPLNHICFTHCVFNIRFLFEYSGGNSAPADCVTNGHGVCLIVMPCFHLHEACG